MSRTYIQNPNIQTTWWNSFISFYDLPVHLPLRVSKTLNLHIFVFKRRPTYSYMTNKQTNRDSGNFGHLQKVYNKLLMIMLCVCLRNGNTCDAYTCWLTGSGDFIFLSYLLDNENNNFLFVSQVFTFYFHRFLSIFSWLDELEWIKRSLIDISCYKSK